MNSALHFAAPFRPKRFIKYVLESDPRRPPMVNMDVTKPNAAFDMGMHVGKLEMGERGAVSSGVGH